MLGCGHDRVLSVPFVGRNDEQFLQGTQSTGLTRWCWNPASWPRRRGMGIGWKRFLVGLRGGWCPFGGEQPSPGGGRRPGQFAKWHDPFGRVGTHPNCLNFNNLRSFWGATLPNCQIANGPRQDVSFPGSVGTLLNLKQDSS